MVELWKIIFLTFNTIPKSKVSSYPILGSIVSPRKATHENVFSGSTRQFDSVCLSPGNGLYQGKDTVDVEGGWKSRPQETQEELPRISCGLNSLAPVSIQSNFIAPKRLKLRLCTQLLGCVLKCLSQTEA